MNNTVTKSAADRLKSIGLKTNLLKASLLLVLPMFLILLSGCGGNRLYADSRFVGTWHWDDNVQWTYVFNADGTGQGGDADVRTFSWGTRNERLILDFGRAFTDHEIRFSFDGDFLTLDGPEGEFSYFRSNPNQDLIGNWVDMESFNQFRWNADGSGSFVHFAEDVEELTWHTANNRLFEHFGPLRQNHWTFTVDGDTLYLESLQVTGFSLELVRGEIYQNQVLVGNWVNKEHFHQFSFFADGSGVFTPFGDDVESFRWYTLGNVLVEHYGPFESDRWEFSVTGDTLVLTNLIDTRLTIELVRGELYEDPRLIGAWAWDGDPDWLYIFEPGGFGDRGVDGQEVDIDWTTFGDYLLLYDFRSRTTEVWRYTITDDILTLFSIDSFVAYGVEFSYIRID